MISYDRARQLGKTYVGALNMGPEEFAALFAPDATVRVGGRDASPTAVREVAPPGRSAFRGARLEPPHVVFTVRVRDRQGVEDLPHRLLVDDSGLITGLEV